MVDRNILDRVLIEMYSRVSHSGISVYAFKGGFILSKYAGSNLRMTADIDISINSKIDFNIIVISITPYLEELIKQKVIYKYVIKEPKVSDGKNVSGSIKLYKKVSDNSPAYVFSGIDISIHDLSYGVVTMADGVKRFSFERMLVDKISVLYLSEDIINRRCRDLYDIYIC